MSTTDTILVVTCLVLVVLLKANNIILRASNAFGRRRHPLTGNKLDKTLRALPRAARWKPLDWRNILATIAIACACPALGARFYYGRANSEEWPESIHDCLLVAGTLSVIVIVAYIPHRLAWRRKALAADFELCTECGHILKGLPIKDKCPECGKPYDLYQVKLIWHSSTKL